MAKPNAQAETAVRLAGKGADKAAKATAKTEAVTAAQNNANEKIASGDVFDLSDPTKADAKGQLGEFGKGTVGGAAKRLAPDLDGKTLDEMEVLLDAEVKAGNAQKTTTKIPDPTDVKKMQDQRVYDFSDGTLIRIKPMGDSRNKGKVMFSIEVKTAKPAARQDGVAFKVDSAGRAVPKSTEDIKNPYDQTKYPAQWQAFEQAVMKAGHRTAP